MNIQVISPPTLRGVWPPLRMFLLIMCVNLGLGCTKDDPQSNLFRGAAEGNVTEVKASIEQGAKVNDTRKVGTPLHRAAYYGHVEVARFLLDHGADVNSVIPADLKRVMEKGYMAALPINQSIDIDDAFGTTPLHHALFHGHREVVELLLSKGADPRMTFTVGPDWKPKYIRSTADAAKMGGHEDLLKLLEKQNPK